MLSPQNFLKHANALGAMTGLLEPSNPVTLGLLRILNYMRGGMFTWAIERDRGFGTSNVKKLLTGVSLAALASGTLVAPPAFAATYYVGDPGELNSAIAAANASADPSSTIILKHSFTVTNTSLTVATKPITIDTQGYTLSGVAGTGATNGAGTVINSAGAVRTLVGTFSGGAAELGSGGIGVSIRLGAFVTNNGTILGGDSQSAAGGTGVDLGGTGTNTTLTNNGTIRGGNGVTGGAGLNVRTGVSPISNTGLIEGGNGNVAINVNTATTSLNLINSGTIRAGIGQADAIHWGTAATTGTITLELQAGSVIVGNVVGNANVGPIDIFRLGGSTNSTFDVSAIGPQYQNFDTLQKTGSSTWSLVGNGTHTGPWEILAGTLQIGNGGTSGSIVSGVTNNATLAFNRSDTLTYGGVITGTGVVNQVGGGTTILTGSNSYTGATNITAGTLRINGNQTGATGLTSVFAGGTLGGTGILGGGLTAFAGGIIAPGNSIGVLTVNGNYTSNGGTLAVEAQLGGDGSPADLLLINGNSLLGLAPTLVQVTNVGGVGGVATNGIKIVDVVGATSDAGAFVLNGPAIGGAYAYRLFQNDLATGTDGDWYLRSAGLAPTTPTLENYPVALLGMTELPTVRQRVGDRVDAADGIWSRIEGATGHYQASSSNTGASYDSSLFLAQVGVEGALVDGPGGSLVAGFSAQYSRNSAAVLSSYGNGSNMTEGVGIGATLTWRGEGGTYLDLQGQLAKFWTDLDAVGYRLVSDNGGAGLAVSLEAGHEIVLDDAWSITPQAQLSYASVGFDRFTDRFGSVISLEAGSSLKGRAGMAVDYRTGWLDAQGHDVAASIGGVAHLTYEFLDGTTVAVSGTNLHYAAQKFGAELGLGGTIEWNGGAQALHADVLGATSFQGSHAVKGTVGFTAGF